MEELSKQLSQVRVESNLELELELVGSAVAGLQLCSKKQSAGSLDGQFGRSRDICEAPKLVFEPYLKAIGCVDDDNGC